ncbi:MAG TPA: relaxase/mobilization nuclease domain-containing protein [Candidatus Fournierella merdipullorum]|uniref:Relaxase/mobilization nuclease domain-containing protein n=1 Tax=Candidatus Allofournierella merdipullorum TaxID=2838595 RepID=A0A9D2E3E6_9FIRM|nr:relaxase/mobilization nuclease domain-containing protein [Candidatus Fournierella merdipullorum]
MAYTSVIPVHRLKASVEYVLDEKKTSRGQNAKSLEEAVDYALNRAKTEQDLFESAIACTCKTAFEDMCQVKEMWHKTGGVQGFHLVQSFAAGEVTPELAHHIGLEFAEQLLQGKYQAVVSTHLNTGHIHNHVVWNSVAIQDGKKYHSTAKSYYTEVRAISDALCQQYGLSVIKANRSDPVGRPYPQWLAERDDRPTWKAAIQQDIDQVVSEVLTWNQFVRALEEKGYTLRMNRKYITLQPPGKARPVRFKTLGKNYTPEAIRRRILYPQSQRPAGEKILPPGLYAVIMEQPEKHYPGLRGLYVTYLFQVGVLPRKPRYPSYAVREDIRKLDERIEQMEFIFAHEIEDRGQLGTIRQTAEAEIEKLTKERKRLYRREPDSPRIEELTARLKKQRKTVRICKRIEEHSLAIEQRLEAGRQEQAERESQQREAEQKEATRKEKQEEKTK